MSKRESPIKDTPLGKLWDEQPGDIYVITGVDTKGRRFKPIHTKSWPHARGINLYRGNKWLERDGKRYRVYSVWN